MKNVQYFDWLLQYGKPWSHRICGFRKKKIVERSSHTMTILFCRQKILHVHDAHCGMQLCIFIETMHMRGLTMLDKLCKDFNLHASATLQWSRNERNVGNCWIKVLPVSNFAQQLPATRNNDMQQGATKSAYILDRRTATWNLLVQQMSEKFSLVYLFVVSFMSNHFYETAWNQNDRHRTLLSQNNSSGTIMKSSYDNQ